MTMILRSSLFVLMLAVTLAGCGDVGTSDVTNDPAYGSFVDVVGIWRTKAPLWLKRINNKLYLSTTSENYVAPTRDVATLPPGTEIRIEHLVLEKTVEIDRLYATGTLVAGPYAGKTTELDERLFEPNYFKHSTVDTTTQPVDALGKRWMVARGKLEK